MREYSLNGKYCRAARQAIAEKLRSSGSRPVLLFDLTHPADEAARALGMCGELFGSLWRYDRLLPDTWTVKWLTRGGDSMAYAVPRDWKDAPVEQTLSSTLLGTGTLAEASLVD